MSYPRWNPDFAYAVGLMTADGNLSPDGRHLAFVSKDMDLMDVFKNCLSLENKISLKSSGYSKNKEKKYYSIQFGDVKLYNFLKLVGLTPNKSKNIGKLYIPHIYFPDFLRGLIDGDGHIHFFKHPESKLLQLNLRVISGSFQFLKWLEKSIHIYFRCCGKIRKVRRAYELNYYKKSSTEILKQIYYSDKISCLRRKFETAELFLSGRGGIGRHASLRS